MAFQPRLNRRRRNLPRSRRGARRRALLIGGLVLIAVVGLIALIPRLPARADPDRARVELAAAHGAFRAGDVTSAREHAGLAARADPSSGEAHYAFAAYLIETGDGLGAQAELDRAKARGIPADRTTHLLAAAALLQGDPARAIATAARAPAAERAYAGRVAARALAAQGATGAAWQRLSALSLAVPGDSRVWSDLGRVHQAAGDLVAAGAAVNRALRADPANPDALLLRGELARAQYGLVAALPWFEAVLKRDPRRHDALIEYAATLGDAGRYRAMLAATRRVLAVNRRDPDALYLQAVLAARAGDDELARGLFNRVRARLTDLPGALLLGGALDYSAGAWQQSARQWSALVAAQPRNVTARRLLAAAMLRAGNPDRALQVLKPVVLRADADSYSLAVVGRAFERRGERDWAAAFLDRAGSVARGPSGPFGTTLTPREVLDRDGDTRASEVELVRALLAADDGGAALNAARRIAAQNSGTPAALLLLGDVQAVRGQWADAVATYRTAANRRFDEPTALRLIAAQDRAGDAAGSRRTLTLFAAQNPVSLAASRLVARYRLAAGDWAGAIAVLETLRDRVGNRDAALLSDLAYAYLGSGDAEGAEAYAAAAYRLAPTNVAAVDAWGWAMFRLGDHDRARQLLEKAVTLAPATGMLHWHLAQTYRALGDNAGAAAQAQAALRDPAFSERTAAQALAGGG